MMDAERYTIKTEIFEGPLELLLDLIEKRKLFINDISLSHVTDDFLNYIKEKGNFPLGLSAQFVLVASTLLLIKSRSLLPTIDLTPEEEASIEDLETRLKEYQRIKELSVHVRKLYGAEIVFLRLPKKNQTVIFSPDESMTASNIAQAARSILSDLPKKEKRPEVTLSKVMTLEETIEKLQKRIAASLRMSFKEFSGHGRTGDASPDHQKKVEIIVGFLAMLELAKQGIIVVRQEDLFDDIHMETEAIDVPRYI